MASVYDEIEIEDMEFSRSERAFYYPCPCGDRFVVTIVRGAGDTRR